MESHPGFGSCWNRWRACRKLLIGGDSDAGQSAGTFSLFLEREGGKQCRQKDCPCGRSKKFYDSSSGWGLPTGRLLAVARSTTVRSRIIGSFLYAVFLFSLIAAGIREKE